MHPRSFVAWLFVVQLIAAAPAQAQAPAAVALLQQSARAMGGLAALRAVNNQIVESEGKQFDSSSTPQPLGPTRQISTFRYTLTRDLKQAKLRLEWDGRNSARNENVRFVEVVDGAVGMLQEGAGKQARLHPGRMATRLREEIRNPIKLILSALANPSLARQADVEIDGKRHTLVSFVQGRDEFRIYLDGQSGLPSRTEILEDDPLEGDSSYMLRYGDWRKVDNLLLPFSLRYELNGNALQEEQIKSIRNNIALAGTVFSLPDAVRNERSDAAPIASQWILRRVAGNVSYQDFGRPPTVDWNRLADGVHKITGTGHATIVIEMKDHLIAIEGPLYDARTAPVVKSIKEKFPNKAIRYVIPTHHHLDHAGGIRAFMAEGATLVAPYNARAFYEKVARAPHTRNPDSMEKHRNDAFVIESFGGGPRILGDGARRVEVHPLPTSHAEDLVVVYLPESRLLIEADHISPRNGQVRGAPAVKEFIEKLDKLGLDVATIVGIHGDQTSLQAARTAAKGSASKE